MRMFAEKCDRLRSLEEKALAFVGNVLASGQIGTVLCVYGSPNRVDVNPL